MTNKSTRHLLIYAGPGEFGNHRYAGGMETEIEPQVLKCSRPVPTGKSMECPGAGASLFLEPEEERFYRRHQLGGVEFPSLEFKSNLIPLEIHAGEGKAGFGKPASLVNGDCPTDLLPVSKFGECRFNDSPLLIGDFRFPIWNIRFKAEFAGGVLDDVLPFDRLKENLAEDAEIMESRVPANLAAVLFFKVVLVVQPLTPIEKLETMLPSDFRCGIDSLHGKEGFEGFPNPQVLFQGCILLVTGYQPGIDPEREGAIFPISRCGSPFNDFFGGADFPGVAGLLDRINSLSGGLLLQTAGVVDPLDPPKRGASAFFLPFIQSSHNVAYVAENLKKANSNRENKREATCFLQRNYYSWFESMRGRSSVYQGSQVNVAENVAEITGGGGQ